MRSTDEQLQEIMRRAEIVKEKRFMRKRLHASAFASCVCVALLTAVCFYLPRLSVTQETPDMKNYGSLLLAAPYMGYVVVGVLAFALGVFITLLCVHWKRLKEKDQVEK